MDISRPVVNLGGRHQLPALGHACDKYGVQVGSGGVNRGRIAGWAGAQNQDFGVLGLGHKNSLVLERTEAKEGVLVLLDTR